SVTLSAPSSGTTGTPMTLNATASDSDGTITRVEFFDGGTKIGDDTISAYRISWTPTSAGQHTLTARATDNAGATTTSNALAVNVTTPTGDAQPPTIAITSPA